MKAKSVLKVYGLILFCLVFISMVEIIGKYPNTGFHSPVSQELRLSGTFGELRTNHFHAGMDIKSMKGVSGDPIYATADGFISRIKVEEYGYGNVLYLQHPNGYTSVYAHLEKFSSDIADYVKKAQYKEESFEVDLDLSKDVFPVRQSQQIGYMGNSGFSFGPHLHFEMRHTREQIPINPLHFGYQIKDDIAPVIQQLIVYEYNESGTLLHSTVFQPNWQSSGQYILEGPVELSSPIVTFGLRTYDTQNGVSNQNGVYSIMCKVDEDPSFAFTMDEIPFEQTRYLNAHIDYKRKINENQFIHRCHPLEGNKLPIYYTGADKGKVYLNTEQPRNISLTVSDFQSNNSSLTFSVKRNYNLLPRELEHMSYQTIAEPDQVSIISQPGLQVVWPQGSFYEKTPLNVEIVSNEGLGNLSPYYELSPADVPVHYYFDIFIEGLAVPEHLRDKAFIARCEPDGAIINCGGNWIGNNLSTGVRQMSTYTILADTVSPTIKVLHFGPKMSGWGRMAFKISDNFRIKDRGRDLLYDAWVDGRWILMSLDGKTGILTHIFDGTIPPGDHQLVIKVIDDRGNEAVLEKTFTL